MLNSTLLFEQRSNVQQCSSLSSARSGKDGRQAFLSLTHLKQMYRPLECEVMWSSFASKQLPSSLALYSIDTNKYVPRQEAASRSSTKEISQL
jgi:hypothetical protein